MSFVKSQTPSSYCVRISFRMLEICLATIGVCAFGAVTSVAAFFIIFTRRKIMGLVSGKCPECGANLKINENAKGELTCPYCGGTYLVENAINIVNNEIINNNNFSGANVVINQNAKDAYIKQYLENARRALSKDDFEEVEKYYNMVEQYDPTNIEAIFFSSYGKASLSMFENNQFKRGQICDVFCKSISVIDDNYNVAQSENNQILIKEMHTALFKMYNTQFVYTVTTNSYGSTDNSSETLYLFAKMAFAFIESLENIIKIDDQLIYWKMIYEQRKYLANNKGLTVDARNKNRELALSVGDKIQEKDPNFVIDEIPEATKYGCYVATCVYGSYDCPEVWTLRRYRDNMLASTWYGRAFIHTYYAISPTLVKWFGKTKWFKKMWKGKLDRMVAKLQAEGVENTPYNDKPW